MRGGQDNNIVIDTNKLKEVFKENGYSMKQIADLLSMDRSSLYRKFNDNGLFTYREIEILLNTLKFDIDVWELFFKDITPTVIVEQKYKSYLPTGT